jgi:hypothetical protein
MKQALAGVLGLCLLPFLGGGQGIVIEGSDGEIIVFGEAVEVAAAAEAPEEEAKPEVEATERQKKLAKLTFDRRPSAVLKTWSKPPEAPADAEEPVEAPPPPAEAPPAAETASEETKEAAKEAERAAKEAEKAAEKERKAAEAKALDAELLDFQRRVALGDWQGVRAYLAGLTPGEAKAGYSQLVKNLAAGPPRRGGQFAQYEEKNFFAPEDVAGLLAAAPAALRAKDAEVAPELHAELGKIVARCLEDGSLVERVVEVFQELLDDPELCLGRTDLARILAEAGQPIESGAFLTGIKDFSSASGRVALNVLARHYVALHERDGKVADLERAWSATQSALAEGEIEDAVKEEALKRAVALAPKLRKELGQAWLDESFTARPERGMEVLAVIGSGVANGLYEKAREEATRLEGLKLQTAAAEALLAAAPERAAEWQTTLNLLAVNWLNEATYTYEQDQSTTRGPALRRDPYGNFFYFDGGASMRGNMPQPIKTGDMLELRPSEAWLAHVAPGLKPKLDMVTAQLHLKLSEEEQAFPFIESLAPVLPERATELVEEFLRVWAKNHNPNTQSQRTNSYVFFFGFEERASGIPLTRSKQERNLAELAHWIERIRRLPIEDVDESLLAQAFTTAHSSAEVFRLESIEQVFGALSDLEPKTLAELVQTMRTNLAGLWRDPNQQKDKGTQRREKDIQAEVLRGYEVARSVTERALLDHPGDWALELARASVAHDENNFRQEVEKSSEFAGRRAQAFAGFARAAELYREGVGELEREKETAQVFESWLYAALGACDVEFLDPKQVAAEAQLALIRAALGALPGEAAERHRALVASSLFTRMSAVNPAVKFRYVRAGLEVVGDHENARAAREVYDYYKDLVTEIRLKTEIDGPDEVGHGAPFGLFVKLHHTREIEREAGGFGKYLVNQNAQAFAFNYGRPTENYRDKFEEAARETLDEHFEVLSITFNHAEAHSRATAEYGWRETPYAYILLKARGPEVDRVPALRFDLDFLDTTGYAVLPVESAPLAIDAAKSEPAPRSFSELVLTQTLDERHAAEKKLVLEVKASALGLVPELDDLVVLDSPGFDVASVEDQGVSVVEFDKESDTIGVLSERLFRVNLIAEPDLAELPEAFAFASPAPGVEPKESILQRYVDEDLETVAASVRLKERYGEKSRAGLVPWILGPLAMLTVCTLAFLYLRRRRSAPPPPKYALPENPTAFHVLGLLNEIRVRETLSPADHVELATHISDIERRYFENGTEADGLDLRGLAERWARR